MRRPSFAVLATAAAAFAAPAANAEEVVVLSSLGIKTVVEDLAPKFEGSTSNDVNATFDLASALKTREGARRRRLARRGRARRARPHDQSRRT